MRHGGAFDAAKNDILRVEQDRDGQWWVKEKIAAEGYCAIRIWATDDSALEHFEDVVLADVESAGRWTVDELCITAAWRAAD